MHFINSCVKSSVTAGNTRHCTLGRKSSDRRVWQRDVRVHYGHHRISSELDFRERKQRNRLCASPCLDHDARSGRRQSISASSCLLRATEAFYKRTTLCSSLSQLSTNALLHFLRKNIEKRLIVLYEVHHRLPC